MMLKVLVLGPLVGKLTLAHAYTPEAQHLPNRSKGDANLVARLSNTHNSLQSIGLAHRKVAGPTETASQGRSLSEKDRALDKRGLTISNLVRVLKLGALTYLARGQHGSRNSETLRQDQKQVRSFLARRGAELHPSTRAELEREAATLFFLHHVCSHRGFVLTLPHRASATLHAPSGCRCGRGGADAPANASAAA